MLLAMLRPGGVPPKAVLTGAAACVVLLAGAALFPSSALASAAEKIMEASRGQLADWMLPMFLAMLPIVEVRGAVPIG